MSETFKDLPQYFNGGNDIIKVDDGGITNYYQFDNEENYKKNLKSQPIDWYYRKNNHLIYNFNSYGYRTEEFNRIDWKNSIVIFGCSLTLGIGVDEQYTLSNLLSEKFNRPVINMGIGAASNELLLYNSVMMKKKYGIPYGIIFLWSGCERTTYFGEENVKHIGAWQHKPLLKIKSFEETYFENTLHEWTHNPIKTFYSIECAKQLWEHETMYFNATYFTATSIYSDILLIPYWDSKARDISHPGNDANIAAAELIYNMTNHGR